MKILNSTPHGQIFACPCHNLLNLEFGNILIKLNYDELSRLTDYVNSIDYVYYLELNDKAANRRKILLDIGFRDIFFALNGDEFMELKRLLSMKNMSEDTVTSDNFNSNKINLN